MTSKRIVTIILICYVLVSAGYISYRLWQDFVDHYSTQAFAQGKAATIQAVIEQASPTTCKSFTVYDVDQQVQLINTACLTNQAADPSAPTTGQ
ncbi:MAG: hypothetical protein WCV88_02335 [Patescibacteria group bacterium]|jgi:hypothetical protein